jgi:hypothetical protein
MAGSLTWRTYIDDSVTPYSIRTDKSNSNASVTGGNASALCPVRTGNHPVLPKGLKPRYVLAYNQANPSERRRFVVGNTSLIPSLLVPGATLTGEDYPGAGDVAGSNVTWVVTYYSGERRKLVPAYTAPDTYLTDGVSTQ